MIGFIVYLIPHFLSCLILGTVLGAFSYILPDGRYSFRFGLLFMRYVRSTVWWLFAYILANGVAMELAYRWAGKDPSIVSTLVFMFVWGVVPVVLVSTWIQFARSVYTEHQNIKSYAHDVWRPSSENEWRDLWRNIERTVIEASSNFDEAKMFIDRDYERNSTRNEQKWIEAKYEEDMVLYEEVETMIVHDITYAGN